MLEGPLLPNIISYTVPIILTSVLQLLFNAADLVIVGRFRGSLSVAAVSATSALINLIVNLFIGLSVGAGVAVAQDPVGADEHTGQGNTPYLSSGKLGKLGQLFHNYNLINSQFVCDGSLS
jgi:Na+-driven multidrug efflux pump